MNDEMTLAGRQNLDGARSVSGLDLRAVPTADSVAGLSPPSRKFADHCNSVNGYSRWSSPNIHSFQPETLPQDSVSTRLKPGQSNTPTNRCHLNLPHRRSSQRHLKSSLGETNLREKKG